MKTRYILIIFAILTKMANCYCQETLTVKYISNLSDNRDDFGAYVFDKSTLITNNKESIYYETPNDTILEIENFGTYSGKELKYKFSYFKNRKEKSVIFDRNYANKSIIKDENYSINWTINENRKEVMGYLCQEATGKFRGRNYKAYFLKDLPYYNGPHKFDGLPGLILEVLSEDKAVAITAYEISLNLDKIINPFKDVKTISWEEFKKAYKKKFDKIINYTPEEGINMTIPNRYIENYID